MHAQMYADFAQSMVDSAALDIDPSLDSLEDTFAPVSPPAPTPFWLGILLSMVSMMGTMVIGSWFTACRSFPTLCHERSDYAPDT
jgi:hypothetical protein